MKLLEEQRKLRKGSVREKSEIEKRSNLSTLDEKKVDGGGETLLPQTVCGGGGTLLKDTFTTCWGEGVSPQTTISHGGRIDMG